ncbi:DUF2092 domain-containing protein [bacterium]|nr:DUF2092 domain-containing protein [bacterium]
MTGTRLILRGAALGIAGLVAVAGGRAGAQTRRAKPAAKPTPAAAAATVPVTLELEPRAIDILKAASATLAAARTMRFTAVVSYENPSLLGPPLVYTTRSEVTLQRPDKLRVITTGDGPPAEFYDTGTQLIAFAPAENLVAVADAPPTVDAALAKAYEMAAMYFPFSDVIVADPYGDLAGSLKLAFYIGQSKIVGGTTTDMIAYATDAVFVQAWIGADDKLPRRLRAIYAADPAQLRHDLELSDWQLDVAIAPDAFASARAASTTRIDFARPDPMLPPGLTPPTAGKPTTPARKK